MPPPTAEPIPPRHGDCTRLRYDDYANQPDPQRIHGGDLSFAFPGPPSHRVTTDQYAVGLPAAYDIGGASETIQPGHNANLFVGAVRSTTKHETARHAAQRLTRCEIQSYAEQDLKILGTRRLASQAVTIDGRSGWSIRTQTAVDDLQNDADGYLIEIIVVDTGKRLSFFTGEIPYPDTERIHRMDRTIDTLQVG